MKVENKMKNIELYIITIGIFGILSVQSFNTVAAEDIDQSSLNSPLFDLNSYNDLFIEGKAVDTMAFSEYVFMQNKPHAQNRWTPPLSKIWQVKYKNGKKYEGYVN
jgi:hypothetical protein